MAETQPQSNTETSDGTAAQASPGSEGSQLEKSTYEIIRNRLDTHAEELRNRMDLLNELRREVFGSIPTELTGTERINTANNCVPRDIIAIGDRMLFGYNVHIGLRTETLMSDVFAVYRADEGGHFVEAPFDLLAGKSFEHDFKQLYKYYKETTFTKFQVIGPYLYLVFQVGKTASDIKGFKFLIEEGSLTYVDNRSDHEIEFPPQHGFEWTRTHRDLHRSGQHPHISIEDRVFVETVGGDLTIKVEDNTDDGLGIYREPVEDKDQTLDDAEIFYAIVGNLVLLRIKPFREDNYRYLIYNEKTQSVTRLDSIEQACVLLPEGHGLIFANGYYLQSGEHKIFESDLSGLTFEKSIPAANGEDYLFVFYHHETGHYVLLSYNMIALQVQTPLICNGYSIFPNGQLICFRSDDTASKHHPLQIWQTPFVDSDIPSDAKTDSFLYKIGNREVVRAMAECSELIQLIGKDDSYSGLYLDLVKKSGDIVDSYFWLSNEETFNLNETVSAVRDAASSAVDEFDKVVRVRRNTREQFDATTTQAEKAISDARVRPYREIADFVQSLGELRSVRGAVISLKELKYVETDAVDSLETKIIEQTEDLSRKCVQFLLKENSLKPYEDRVVQQQSSIESLATVAETKKLEEELIEGSGELEMLIDIVSNLKIDDATHRTQIIDNISTIYANLNKTRAQLKKRSQSLMSVEGAAEFNSQLKLLSQAIVNYLDVCDKPQKCDEYLTKMMVQIEELEGRFSEFDEFIGQLAEKREEVYAAFDNKKLQLNEARNRRATALMNSADRILTGISSRMSGLKTVDEINSYFASDLMIEKVRNIIEQLDELDESVKVDDVQSRLKTTREDAVRQLRDKNELYVDGQNIIAFGEHKFSVNVQPLDLTTVFKDGDTWFHLSGTNYFEKIEDEQFVATRDVWDQTIVSENRDVYRGEYLAYLILQDAMSGKPDSIELSELARMEEPQLTEHVQKFMSPRYAEGYVKGVHDHDATLILSRLCQLTEKLDLLKYSTSARVLATVFWNELNTESKETLQAKFSSLAEAQNLFGAISGRQRYVDQIGTMIQSFIETHQFSENRFAGPAAACLFDQFVLARTFVASSAAVRLKSEFEQYLGRKDSTGKLAASIQAETLSAVDRYEIARDWIGSFCEHNKQAANEELIAEAAAMLADHSASNTKVIEANPEMVVSGLLGDHVLVDSNNYELNYNQFMDRLHQFETETTPRYEAYVHLKKELIDQRRDQLRLNEFKPRVLTSFVRNKLVNDIYLPMVGANLAKQIGVVGEDKRTDLMGLLLLISPPGYGKTTLMEYIANRLGITFVKINGPAIGHRVTSLDPVEAPNASAREEVEKLNLSLEMGDNVMIYLDDIQHCNPEFLQKFISLCDATRKIEGVFNGKTRTYDLRGRKVCVIMAGNPYTESGDKFQIPDMLANRADTYNLGDVIGDSLEPFELSYLENCLTSNSTLGKLNSRSRNDIYSIIKMAEHPDAPPQSLEGNYSIEEINEFVGVMRKLLRVRDVILRVNREYIDSAAQSDDYRTEPAFKLQGSYRDMNKIAERIVPIMNDNELEVLIMSHYENQAQTLTTGAEANLLKFRQMTGTMTPEQETRWEEICRTYKRNQVLGAAGGDDQMSQVIAQMATFSDGLGGIGNSLDKGLKQMLAKEAEKSDGFQEITVREITRVVGELSKFNETIESMKASYEKHGEAIANLPRHISEQKIEVVNKIPNVMLNVLRNQFRVLQTWMEPILELATHNPAAQSFVSAANATEANYERLLDRLGNEATTEEAAEPPAKKSAAKKATPKKAAKKSAKAKPKKAAPKKDKGRKK